MPSKTDIHAATAHRVVVTDCSKAPREKRRPKRCRSAVGPTSARLERVIAQLAEAKLNTRQDKAGLAEAIASRALLQIATGARRR